MLIGMAEIKKKNVIPPNAGKDVGGNTLLGECKMVQPL